MAFMFCLPIFQSSVSIWFYFDLKPGSNNHGLDNFESTQDCAGTEKTSERSCSMSSEQYCVYTTEVDFAEARFVKASIFHKSLWQKIVLPNKKWQLLSSSFGHLQHTIHNTLFGCNPSQLQNEITIFIFKLKIKHTVWAVNNGKFGNPPGTSAGFPDSQSLRAECLVWFAIHIASQT